MDAVHVFDEHAQEYERWFDEHERLYQAEVNALSKFIPSAGLGVEIGVGTGRFSVPFGVSLGSNPVGPWRKSLGAEALRFARHGVNACLFTMTSSILL